MRFRFCVAFASRARARGRETRGVSLVELVHPPTPLNTFRPVQSPRGVVCARKPPCCQRCHDCAIPMGFCSCLPDQTEPTPKHELKSPPPPSSLSLLHSFRECVQSSFRLGQLDEGNSSKYWAPVPVRRNLSMQARSRATPTQSLTHAKPPPPKASPEPAAKAKPKPVDLTSALAGLAAGVARKGAGDGSDRPLQRASKEGELPVQSPLQTPLTKLRKKPLIRPVVPWDQPLDPKLAAHWAEPCGADVGLGIKLKDVLRHKAVDEGLEISSEGWMRVEEALRYVNRFEPNYDEAGVRTEVAINQRFQVRDDPRGPFIRAVRGHTMKGVNSGSDTARSAASAKSTGSAKSDETKRSNSPRGDVLPRRWVPATPRPYDELRDPAKGIAKADFRGGYINYFRLLQEADEEAWVQANGPRKLKDKAAKARVAF
jgi:hypothetical protein